MKLMLNYQYTPSLSLEKVSNNLPAQPEKLLRKRAVEEI